MEIEKLFQIAELYLEYLSVFLSWPVMVVAVLLIFFCKFHSALDHLIRTLLIKTPAGYSLQSQSQQPIETKDKELPESDTLTENGKLNIIGQIIEKLVQKEKFTEKEMDKLREQSAIEFRDSVIWKFRYLDLFFVNNTKWVLSWFSIGGSSSRQNFDRIWSQIIPDYYAQRDIILNSLIYNDFIRETDGIFEVTSEGRLFLKFIGWNLLPPLSS